MKFLNTDVWGFKHALRGMRNPMNSWNKSDSGYAIKDYELHDGEEKIIYDEDVFGIGSNDIGLMQRLINGGPEHRKFMRQIMVSIDITAPLYWWKEFDTYKIGTTANSTSTMHKLASNPITIEDFEMDDFKKVKVYDKEPYNYDTYTDEIWESRIPRRAFRQPELLHIRILNRHLLRFHLLQHIHILHRLRLHLHI